MFPSTRVPFWVPILAHSHVCVCVFFFLVFLWVAEPTLRMHRCRETPQGSPTAVDPEVLFPNGPAGQMNLLGKLIATGQLPEAQPKNFVFSFTRVKRKATRDRGVAIQGCGLRLFCSKSHRNIS